MKAEKITIFRTKQQKCCHRKRGKREKYTENIRKKEVVQFAWEELKL